MSAEVSKGGYLLHCNEPYVPYVPYILILQHVLTKGRLVLSQFSSQTIERNHLYRFHQFSSLLFLKFIYFEKQTVLYLPPSLGGCPEAAVSNVHSAVQAAISQGALGMVLSHWSGVGHITHQPFWWPGLITCAGLAWNSDVHWVCYN